jgi:hypothetical protein
MRTNISKGLEKSSAVSKTQLLFSARACRHTVALVYWKNTLAFTVESPVGFESLESTFIPVNLIYEDVSVVGLLAFV